MTAYYYCIDPVLRHAESGETAQKLITVSRDPRPCNGHTDDCFVLSNPVHMLRMDESDAADNLAQLMKEVPLYHFNMELVLDEALSLSQTNNAIREALLQAFGRRALPVTQPVPDIADTDYLYHPDLRGISLAELSQIYIAFLLNLKRQKEEYSFQRNILRHHTQEFLQQFDGFFEEQKGQIRADILLAFGLRLDHDPHKPLENYINSGQQAARRKNISEPHELLWAWLECDNYQQRRSRDMHRVMSLTSLPRLPNWIRIDAFKLLEMEAMKQIFAEKMVLADPDLSVLRGALELKRAIRTNTLGRPAEELQQLTAEALKGETLYSGVGLKFCDAVDTRQKEARLIK